MAESQLIKKLRIKSGQRIAILHAPSGYRELLGELPEGVTVSDVLDGRFDIIHGFYTKLDELTAESPELKSSLEEEGGILWVSYPKLSAKQDSDLSRDIIWTALGDRGLKAVAQISVDETWSAMRFKRVD